MGKPDHKNSSAAPRPHFVFLLPKGKHAIFWKPYYRVTVDDKDVIAGAHTAGQPPHLPFSKGCDLQSVLCSFAKWGKTLHVTKKKNFSILFCNVSCIKTPVNYSYQEAKKTSVLLFHRPCTTLKFHWHNWWLALWSVCLKTCPKSRANNIVEQEIPILIHLNIMNQNTSTSFTVMVYSSRKESRYVVLYSPQGSAGAFPLISMWDKVMT